MTPEAKVRQNIDALLVASGRHVCSAEDSSQICVVGEAHRHLFLVREAEVDANLKRAQALRQATLAKGFSNS